jgi:ribosomal protein L6P/L9E
MPLSTHFLLYSLFMKTVSGYIQGYKQQLYLKGRGLKATLFEHTLLFKLDRTDKVIILLPFSIKVSISNFQNLTFVGTNY